MGVSKGVSKRGVHRGRNKRNDGDRFSFADGLIMVVLDSDGTVLVSRAGHEMGVSYIENIPATADKPAVSRVRLVFTPAAPFPPVVQKTPTYGGSPPGPTNEELLEPAEGTEELLEPAGGTK